MTKSRLKKYILYICGILICGGIIFVIWANDIYTADQVKLARVLSSQDIIVTEHPSYWQISPSDCDGSCTRGLIYYPGAKVDPRAYFYKFSDLTTRANGHWTVYITKPTLHLAFFSIGQADTVIRENPSITEWTLGGHSMGGAMMCEYLKNSSHAIRSLVLVASYCASDISERDIHVISLHGSLDGVLDISNLIANQKNLPKDAQDIVIDGMNHAQAGNYGDQKGDNQATLSDESVKSEIEKVVIQESKR